MRPRQDPLRYPDDRDILRAFKDRTLMDRLQEVEPALKGRDEQACFDGGAWRVERIGLGDVCIGVGPPRRASRAVST